MRREVNGYAATTYEFANSSWMSIGGGGYCASATLCVGYSSSTVTTYTSTVNSNGQIVWTSQSYQSGMGNISALTCSSPTLCISATQASGLFINPYTGNLNSTNAVEFATFDPIGYSNFTPTKFYYVDNYNIPYEYYFMPNYPDSNIYVNSITCVSATDCLAAGSGYDASGPNYQYLAANFIFETTDGGASASETDLSFRYTDSNISCLSISSCWMVGSSNSIYRTTDFGATWQLQTIPFAESQVSDYLLMALRTNPWVIFAAFRPGRGGQ